MIALLSDFGQQDIYVAVLKGVIAQIHPQIRVLDLTHQIPPHDIAAARFNLINAVAYLPVGTVYIAVVDPGVGSQRRAIALETPQGYFVGPDNGVFSGIWQPDTWIQGVELTHRAYWRTPDPSPTFHGRDIFAPVGAHLACGVPLPHLGRAIAPESLVVGSILAATATTRGMTGLIQYIDHFGNLITNIPGDWVQGQGWYSRVRSMTIPGCHTYSD